MSETFDTAFLWKEAQECSVGEEGRVHLAANAPVFDEPYL